MVTKPTQTSAPQPVAKKPATKTVAAPAAAKPAAKKAVKAPVATKKPATKVIASVKPVVVAAKPVKVKKPKLVRDSFTMPKLEYTVLDDLKQRAGKLSKQVKKSELIRAGIKALAAMSDAAFVAALAAVPTIKTGRPNSKSD